MTTKERLVESARKLIAERGYNNTKVEDITQNAEVAKGTFYTYFKTKEEIFIEILKTVFEKTELALNQLIFNDGLKNSLYKFISFMYKGSFEDKDTFKIISSIFTNPELMSTIIVIDKCSNGLRTVIKKLLESNKEEIIEEVIEKLSYIYSPIDEFIKSYMGVILGFNDRIVEMKNLSDDEIEKHINFMV